MTPDPDGGVSALRLRPFLDRQRRGAPRVLRSPPPLSLGNARNVSGPAFWKSGPVSLEDCLQPSIRFRGRGRRPVLSPRLSRFKAPMGPWGDLRCLSCLRTRVWPLRRRRWPGLLPVLPRDPGAWALRPCPWRSEVRPRCAVVALALVFMRTSPSCGLARFRPSPARRSLTWQDSTGAAARPTNQRCVHVLTGSPCPPGLQADETT